MENAIVTGTAERLLPGGEALVRTHEGACLVANAVPGDALDLRLEARRRGAMRATIAHLATPSPQRLAEPMCPVAETCGGCALQYVDPRYQAEIKNAWVREAFAPHFHADSEFTGITEHEVAPGRRRRVRWHRGTDDGGVYWGFRARASHAVVRHDVCPTATPAIQALHAMLSGLNLPGVDAVQVTELADGLHLVLEGVLETDGEGAFPGLPDRVEGLVVQAWRRGKDGIARPLTRPVRTLHDRLPAGDASIDLVVGPDDFIQASREGNEAMIRQVQAWGAGARRAADLFAGFGNLSLPLAALGVHVLGAEVNGASVAAANRSARALDVDASYRQADLFARFDPAPFAGMDLLILDPPRKGAKRVCSMLPRLLPRRIILISCDIAAGARDAAAIAGHGYRLTALRALDMFPYAGHVEAMGLWEL